MPGKVRSKLAAKPAKGRSDAEKSDAQEIDTMFRGLGDWRGERLSELRQLIREVCPDVLEQIKWRKPSNPAGSPVWSHKGILCLGNFWKDHARLTFSNGALLPDPHHVFNAALNGNHMRALDLREGDSFDREAVRNLIRAAVAFNDAQSQGP